MDAYVKQVSVNQTGNRCGHIVNNPRMFLEPSDHKKRFPLMERLKHRIRQSYSFPLARRGGRLHYHEEKFIKIGRYRKARSEFRAFLAHEMLPMLIHYTNIERMIFGDVQNNKCIYYDSEHFVKVLGCTRRRARRGLRWLEAKGYVRLQKRFNKRPDGVIEPLPAHIHIDESLFLDFDIDKNELAMKRHKIDKFVEAHDREQSRQDYNKQARVAHTVAKQATKQERKENAYNPWATPETPKRNQPYNREHLPGSERRREVAPIYRDYTDILAERRAQQAKGIEQKPLNEPENAKGPDFWLNKILADLAKPPH